MKHKKKKGIFGAFDDIADGLSGEHKKRVPDVQRVKKAPKTLAEMQIELAQLQDDQGNIVETSEVYLDFADVDVDDTEAQRSEG